MWDKYRCECCNKLFKVHYCDDVKCEKKIYDKCKFCHDEEAITNWINNKFGVKQDARQFQES